MPQPGGIEHGGERIVKRLQASAEREAEQRDHADHQVEDAKARLGNAIIGGGPVGGQRDRGLETRGYRVAVQADVTDLAQRKPKARGRGEHHGEDETTGQQIFHVMREYRGESIG